MKIKAKQKRKFIQEVFCLMVEKRQFYKINKPSKNKLSFGLLT
jgi:hypothetical protein